MPLFPDRTVSMDAIVKGLHDAWERLARQTEEERARGTSPRGLARYQARERVAADALRIARGDGGPGGRDRLATLAAHARSEAERLADDDIAADWLEIAETAEHHLARSARPGWFADDAPPAQPEHTPHAPTEPAANPWKVRRGERLINGRARRTLTITFTGSTEAEYDAFLDARFAHAPGAEPIGWKQGSRSPTVDIDGQMGWASYESFAPDPAPPA